MNSSLRLRLLTREDLRFADSVRALAGWNQTLEDWERFLATEPTGCFLAEWNGVPAGTATTTVYGPSLAWIGMVLVHPGHRRKGIGRSLLLRCIEYLRERGARCIKLDATPLGRTVYEGLGFQAEWTLARWSGRAAPTPLPSSPPASRQWQDADAPLVDALDAVAFGVSRQRLLTALSRQSLPALVVESAPGRIVGHGMARRGARAFYLGPVVASSADAGIALLDGLAARSEGATIFCDIPDLNTAAVSWAEGHGFTLQRPLIRMFLGDNIASGDPRQQFALAGPEVG
jgi:GNAT superfamily N-acetyltransferase